jgi:hypothetical protein
MKLSDLVKVAADRVAFLKRLAPEIKFTVSLIREEAYVSYETTVNYIDFVTSVSIHQPIIWDKVNYKELTIKIVDDGLLDHKKKVERLSNDPS